MISHAQIARYFEPENIADAREMIKHAIPHGEFLLDLLGEILGPDETYSFEKDTNNRGIGTYKLKGNVRETFHRVERHYEHIDYKGKGTVTLTAKREVGEYDITETPFGFVDIEIDTKGRFRRFKGGLRIHVSSPSEVAVMFDRMRISSPESISFEDNPKRDILEVYIDHTLYAIRSTCKRYEIDDEK